MNTDHLDNLTQLLCIELLNSQEIFYFYFIRKFILFKKLFAILRIFYFSFDFIQLSTYYTNELMATRFSDVMWLIEQIMWKSLDKRLASFLLEETSIEGTNELKITHETIANHLGSHREVITRMLRYFQGEGLVKLSRGKITILDPKRLETLQRS